MSAQPQKYAVQRPKGTKWETLALVDDAALARREYAEAIGRYGHRTFVRLIQVQFKSGDLLADYDWRLIELHDPMNRKDRPNLKVVSSNQRAGTKWQPGSKDQNLWQSGRQRRPGEKVPVPFPTYVAAFLFGALSILIWGIWFRT